MLENGSEEKRALTYGMGDGPKPDTSAAVGTNDAPSAEDEKRKRPASFWISIIVAVLCIALIGVLAYTMLGSNKTKRVGDTGQLEGKSKEEIQAELDRVVQDGMFNISISSNVEFENGTSEGELRIENVPNNHYLMNVVITRDDDGQQIYESGYLEPNHHIQRDKLDVELPKGKYDCTAVFYAMDLETEELVGQAAAKMTVVVNE